MLTLHHLSPLSFALAFLVVLIGYWASVAITTWAWRATFFLTMLIVSVLGHSPIGVISTAPPAIVCVFYFEREQMRRRQRSRYSRSRLRRYAGFPVETWDGLSPICVFDKSRYFTGEDDIRAYLDSLPVDSEPPRLCATAPIFLNKVTTYDLAFGEVELEKDIQAALDHLNELIEVSAPISYEQRDTAIDLEDLKRRVLRLRRRPDLDAP